MEIKVQTGYILYPTDGDRVVHHKVSQICGILLDLTADLAGHKKGTGVYDILRASSEEEVKQAVDKIVNLLESSIAKLKEL